MESKADTIRNLDRISRLGVFFNLLRVKHWVKNIFVFAGFLFGSILSLNELVKSLQAFFLLCLTSSCVYIINDIADIERDRFHPVKCNRPLPSGKVKISTAVILFILICSISLPLSFMLNQYFGIISIIYLVMNILYSLKLKNVVLVDLLVIATGFVLRVISGFVVVEIEIPLLLILSTAFCTLYLGLNKRKREICVLSHESMNHRKNLEEYSIEMINEILPVMASGAIISYAMYTIYESYTKYMALTVPLVVYGVLRYQYLTNNKSEGENPVIVLIGDFPLKCCLVIFGMMIITIQFFISLPQCS